MSASIYLHHEKLVIVINGESYDMTLVGKSQIEDQLTCKAGFG